MSPTRCPSVKTKEIAATSSPEIQAVTRNLGLPCANEAQYEGARAFFELSQGELTLMGMPACALQFHFVAYCSSAYFIQ